MPISENPNIEILETAVAVLGGLVDKVVFFGGCATGLLLTDPAAPPLRVTQDVGVLLEVGSLTAYYKFSEMLRQQGFAEDSSPQAPI